MAFSASSRHHALAEINVTPLIEVLLLLVGFMVSMPLVAEPLQASLPQASPLPAPTPRPALELEFAADGAYRLDGRLMASAQLEQRFEQALIEGNRRAPLNLHANSDARYQAVVTALDAARASGMLDVAMVP